MTPEAKAVAVALELYPRRECRIYADNWRKPGIPALLYSDHRGLREWFEIESDTLRYCRADTTDGGAWGIENGVFYAVCFYWEAKDRADLAQRIRQLHRCALYDENSDATGNAYLSAKDG